MIAKGLVTKNIWLKLEAGNNNSKYKVEII